VLPDEALLRNRDGRPLTSRRYDHLWWRIGIALPWVAAQGISTHWLRHTTLTWVERHFGYGVARAYAGHTDAKGPATHDIHQSRSARRGHRVGRDDRATASPRHARRVASCRFWTVLRK
jgi:integrase